MPQSYADVWLMDTFVRYERIVSAHLTGKAEQREIDLALFGYRGNYRTALEARPQWRHDEKADVSPLDMRPDKARWHRVQIAF